MPWMTIPIATAIAGAAGAGATAYGAHRSASAAREASRANTATTNRAMEIEAEAERRRQAIEDEDRRIAMEDRARTQRLEDEERELFYAQEARRAPYRAASDAALRSMAASIGIDLSHVPAREPAVWRPGSIDEQRRAGRSWDSMVVEQRRAADDGRRAPITMAESVRQPSASTMPMPSARLDPGLTMADEVVNYRRKPRYI